VSSRLSSTPRTLTCCSAVAGTTLCRLAPPHAPLTCVRARLYGPRSQPRVRVHPATVAAAVAQCQAAVLVKRRCAVTCRCGTCARRCPSGRSSARTCAETPSYTCPTAPARPAHPLPPVPHCQPSHQSAVLLWRRRRCTQNCWRLEFRGAAAVPSIASGAPQLLALRRSPSHYSAQCGMRSQSARLTEEQAAAQCRCAEGPQRSELRDGAAWPAGLRGNHCRSNPMRHGCIPCDVAGRTWWITPW